MSRRAASWLAWSLVGIYLVLIIIGLAFEFGLGSFFSGLALVPAIAEVVAISVWVIVGALLASRQPYHPIGWIWCSIAVLVSIDHFSWGYATYGLLEHPGSLPGVEASVAWLYANGRQLGLIPITLLFLLFPTGRFLSRRWRIVAWAVVISVAIYIPLTSLAPNPLGFFPFPKDVFPVNDSVRAIAETFQSIPLFIANICVVIALFSLLIRLSRSGGIERQQLKWFVYAAIIFIPALIFIALSGSVASAEQELIFTIGISLALLAITGMSVASAIAIFKYRLYDIDIIINRTLVYGLLTAVLAFTYFASVALLQQGLRWVTGQDSPLAVVVSTLLIAALFSPLRKRLQNFIDRRFYRRKYDAERTLAQFAISARDEVDLDELTAELVCTVNQTIQPESVRLWLKE